MCRLPIAVVLRLWGAHMIGTFRAIVVGAALSLAGTALSYKNNQISGNGTDIVNGTLQAAPRQ